MLPLVTLVATLCSGPLCLEKVITTSDQNPMTEIGCNFSAQQMLAQWLPNSQWADWEIRGFKCVEGKYVPKIPS